MSQISEIPASAYTPEMEVLGALPDIPMFDGEPEPANPWDATIAAPSIAGFGISSPSRHAGRSCVARLFFHEQLRDTAVLVGTVA
ncbi:hypothetical protein JCGZ_03140 [Jatropha curcas]|uniref:Uncharacterized protein n=1 Tax=Jatropha curcas TaxID=180498 RepID=A0A067L1N4_JATCU|nr:hypothetical protein JCGZ_03140 [Jatropha curcas]